MMTSKRIPESKINNYAQEAGITVKQLRSRMRVTHIKNARWEVVRRLKSEGYSYREIGRAVNKDDTTIFYICSDKLKLKKKLRYESSRGKLAFDF